ncbi:MAG: hypothetical protein IKI21_01425 [Oscillospiraceae bacterium]|nr:hypothetical protein [Oscillospiraceae bacterium]
MQAIIFCDEPAVCLPMQDCPAALLPVGSAPLLVHLLTYLERMGFRRTVLLSGDPRVRRIPDTMHLTMPVRFARSMASLYAEEPTLLLRSLCLPVLDMGELHAVCARGAARLFHPDGTSAGAELHPAGSPLLEPEETAVVTQSQFRRVADPAAYRALVTETVAKGSPRIGEGLRCGRDVVLDERSILGTDCALGDGAVVEDCILGDGVQVGAGAVLRGCIVCRGALIDRDARLEGGIVPEGDVLAKDARTTRPRRMLVLPEDGICGGDPRWNTAASALEAGAAMASLGGRIAVGYAGDGARPYAMAAAAGALSQGADVWQTGRCALSMLLFAAQDAGCDAVLWATGDTVVRLLPFAADGAPLSEGQAARLWQALAAHVESRILSPGTLTDSAALLRLWEDGCRRLVPAARPSVRVSCADPTLRAAAERLFSGGTGEEITLTLSEDGRSASAFSLETGMLRREMLLLPAMAALAREDGAFVLPEDAHPGAAAYAQAHGIRLLDGETSEGAALRQRQGVCTDGVRLFAAVLREMAYTGQTLRELTAPLPRLCTVVREVVTPLTRQEVADLGERAAAPQVVIVKPPHSRIARLRVHADTMEAAAELCGEWERSLHAAEA